MNPITGAISPQLLVAMREEQALRYPWGNDLIAARRPLEDIAAVLDVSRLRRLAAERQRDGTVAITFVTYNYLAVGLNWVESLRRLGLSHFVVIAGDPQTASAMSDRGIENVEAATGASSLAVNFKSPAEFSREGLAMATVKFPVVRELLGQGLNVVFSDADALWLRDPTPYLQADLAFQRITHFPRMISRLWGFAACTGFLYFRSSQPMLEFLDACIEEHKRVHDDQVAFNLALLAAGVRWDAGRDADGAAAPDYAASDAQFEAAFAAIARQPICGQVTRGDLTVTALPHHLFWRHSWVSSNQGEMVVCHPNSPKVGAQKMELFKTRGLVF